MIGCWLAFWLLYTRRWFRVKAIVLLAMAPASIPGVTIMAQQFGITISVDGYGPWAAVLAIVGICALCVLEVQSNRGMIVGATLSAFIRYVESFERGDPPQIRQGLLEQFEAQPDVDKSIFRMCTVMELVYASRNTSASSTPEATKNA